jgi:hypothetical protein
MTQVKTLEDLLMTQLTAHEDLLMTQVTALEDHLLTLHDDTDNPTKLTNMVKII